MSWAGPWPVDEGWWRPEGASRRAYLQVLADSGPPLLLVRAGRWWLDAVYDLKGAWVQESGASNLYSSKNKRIAQDRHNDTSAKHLYSSEYQEYP